MRQTNPNGDLAVMFDRALSLLLEDLEKRKVAATDDPRDPRPVAHESRHIAAVVKRQVWRSRRSRR